MNESENISASPPQIKGSDYLADIIKSIGTGSLEPSPIVDKARQSPPQSDILSSLLSNPELLAKLPTIISTVKPFLEIFAASSGQGGPARQDIPAAAKTDGFPVMAKNKEHGGNAHRSALLCALKPYLSSDRRQAIDYIIKLDRLGDVLKTL